MLSAGGGCEIMVTTRVKTAWKKFRELLPVLRSGHLSYKTSGHVSSSYVQIAMPEKVTGFVRKKLTEKDCREWKLMTVDP